MSEIEIIQSSEELLVELGPMLQGAPGATGATGPQGPGFVFLGEVATVVDLPESANVNDAYLVLEDNSYYAWNGVDWVDIGQISGPTGATGPVGLTGSVGATGLTGATGVQGYIGPTGASGLRGEVGATGVKGATGPQGIIGHAGSTGPQGNQGVQGAQGAQGNQGNAGPTGPQGVQGIQGSLGPTGVTGVRGATGVTGPAGATGVLGPTGPSGARGSTGPVGDTGATGATGQIGATGLTGGIGATGPQGANGATGLIGPTGLTGSHGSTGLAGPTGVTGVTGPVGATGLTGSRGATGVQGATGVTGPVGATGVTGNTGATGAQGLSINFKGAVNTVGDLPSSGNVRNDAYVVLSNGDLYVWDGTEWDDVGPIVGPTGPQGPTGVAGPTGANGATGPTGIQGTTGPTGVMGPTGTQGPVGYDGATGMTGLQGSTGPTGTQGPVGYDGATGMTGVRGSTGPTGLQGPVGYDGATGMTGLQGVTGPTGLGYANLTSSTSFTIGTVGYSTFTVNQSAGANAFTSGMRVRLIYGPSNYIEGLVVGYTGTTLGITVDYSYGSGTYNSWKVEITGLPGVTGPVGFDGATGMTGPQGSTGLQGIQGIQGIQGTQGPTGPQGIQGIQGIQGAVGYDGATGMTGIQGSTGPIGATGLQGVTGPVGATGLSGATGPAGATGVTGIGYAGLTSSTTYSIGTTGFQIFAVNQSQGTNAFTTGMRVRLIYGTSNYIEGVIASYSGTNLGVSVDYGVGSGSYSTWKVEVTGQVGATGPTSSGWTVSSPNITTTYNPLVNSISLSWHASSNYFGVQGGNFYAYNSGSGSGTIGLCKNIYLNSSLQWIYTDNGYGSLYYQTGGQHVFSTSTTSGVIGNTATLSAALIIQPDKDVECKHDLDVTNAISINGNYGTTGQYLTSAGGGVMTWTSGTPSDYRLKENIYEITNAVDRIKNVKAYSFNMIGKNDTIEGFLAHELKSVCDSAVIGEKDGVDIDGNPVYQRVVLDALIPVMAQAIKDLIKRMEALESKE